MAGKKGLVIYFDGPDGVGKTTQMKQVAEFLQAQGRKVYMTRTLGGTPIGEELREVIISAHRRPVETDFHIALAVNYALISELVKRREAGEVVLVDRSPLSIIGFQVSADGLDRHIGYEAVHELLGIVKPDLILVYTASSASLQTRRRERNHQLRHDYFESKPVEYHAKVAAGFIKAAQEFGAHLIDADAPIEAVQAASLRLIQPLL